MRNAIAFDGIHAARRRVEQRIDERIRQQVDFIDIQHAVVRLREQARRKTHRAVAQHGFDIERADQAIFTRAERQVHQLPLRQQLGERARRGRFGRAARPADQHAAQPRIDRGQQQRLLQRRLADQRGKRKSGPLADRWAKPPVVTAGVAAFMFAFLRSAVRSRADAVRLARDSRPAPATNRAASLRADARRSNAAHAGCAAARTRAYRRRSGKHR